MSMGLILNGIRSVQPIMLGSLDCFEASMKCDYGTCKRLLHRIFIELISGKELCTYELRALSKERCHVRFYVKNPSLVCEIKSKLADIIDGELKHVGKHEPTYLAIETFFDLVVNAAFNKVGFEYVKGRGRVLDPSDLGKALEKRTIVEVRDINGKEKYYGVLFIDYSMVNRSSVADKMLGELEIDDFEELRNNDYLKRRSIEVACSYINKHVLTLIMRKEQPNYVYGRIVSIEPMFACKKKFNEKSVYDIWFERYQKGLIETKPSMWEYPLFKVELKGAKYRSPLTYPPSALRLLGSAERPDPRTRWDNIVRLVRGIEDAIKDLYRSLTGRSIRFKYIKFDLSSENVGFKPNFFTGSDSEASIKNYTVKLKYRCQEGEKSSRVSPLYAFDKKDWAPYAGEQFVSLIVIYPSVISDADLKMFTDNLVRTFEELNLGVIENLAEYIYKYDPANLSESLTSLENTLIHVLSLKEYSQYKHLLFIIIPDNEKFYELSKENASRNGYHSQIMKLTTFENVVDSLAIANQPHVSGKIKQKALETAKLALANLCGGIYVEFLIQKGVSEGNIAGPLTWILASPADGNGRSMYVGLDISTKRGVAGAAFIMLDPYGRLIGGKAVQLKTETLSYRDYYDVLRYMVSNARERKMKRIVILRDGPPRKPQELKDCLSAFNRVVKELNYNVSLDYVSIIKRSVVRVFERGLKDGVEVANPVQGTYVYLYKLKHFGYVAHEVAIVASKSEDEEGGGTVRPIILRVYELNREYPVSEVKKLAEEYLALTRLDFWNLRTGASKLALPIKMADILSRMLATGIPIRM